MWSNSGVLICMLFVSCLIIPSQRHSPKFSSNFKALGFCPGLYFCWTSQVALIVKNPPVNAGDKRDVGLIPGSGRSSGEGNGILVFLPGEFQGQRGVESHSPWGRKELDTPEQLTLIFVMVQD